MRQLLIMSAMALGLCASAADANPMAVRPWVSLEFVGEHGELFRNYPTASEGPGAYRAYLEAMPEARYSIRARNLSGERVGIVIAVDGRNIISGERSDLERTESMYILGPYESATYAGWRTSEREIRRFYFTNATDSYAGRIGDTSALGVIAAAVYRERSEPERIAQLGSADAAQAPAPAAETQAGAARRSAESAQAGTGFGESQHSRAIRVAFTPLRRPVQRAFFKYEWTEQLCARGLKACGPGNRFWPESDRGFVPLPPDARG